MDEICSAIVPVAPVRKTASDTSEMVTQLLYGEKCAVLDADKQWRYVRCFFDGYEGWVDEKQIASYVEASNTEPGVVSTMFMLGKASDREQILLPCGAQIQLSTIDRDVFIHQKKAYGVLAGDYLQEPQHLALEAVFKLAGNFINAPYLWGGKSAFGIDCSGFTQVLFKVLGEKLPRDASQQANIGEKINHVNDALAGDLAFFGKDKVTHVGLLLDSQTIIHASGKVRIDAFHEKGIFNAEKGEITHPLKGIKRIIGG